jgi:hypothetical protein
MRLRDAWMASRAAALAARQAFPRRRPRLREAKEEKGERRKKKEGDVASDWRVPQVSDARAWPCWRRSGSGLVVGPRLGRKGNQAESEVVGPPGVKGFS